MKVWSWKAVFRLAQVFQYRFVASVPLPEFGFGLFGRAAPKAGLPFGIPGVSHVIAGNAALLETEHVFWQVSGRGFADVVRI